MDCIGHCIQHDCALYEWLTHWLEIGTSFPPVTIRAWIRAGSLSLSLSLSAGYGEEKGAGVLVCFAVALRHVSTSTPRSHVHFHTALALTLTGPTSLPHPSESMADEAPNGQVNPLFLAGEGARAKARASLSAARKECGSEAVIKFIAHKKRVHYLCRKLRKNGN